MSDMFDMDAVRLLIVVNRIERDAIVHRPPFPHERDLDAIVRVGAHFDAGTDHRGEGELHVGAIPAHRGAVVERRTREPHRERCGRIDPERQLPREAEHDAA